MRIETKVKPGCETYCSLNAREHECHPVILAPTASATYISSDCSRTNISQRRGRNGNESSEGSPTHDFGLQGRFSVVEMTDETERHTRIYTGTSRSLLLRTVYTFRARRSSSTRTVNVATWSTLTRWSSRLATIDIGAALVTDFTDKPKTRTRVERHISVRKLRENSRLWFISAYKGKNHRRGRHAACHEFSISMGF